MRAAGWLLAVLVSSGPLPAEEIRKLEAPTYSPASIVNSATNLPGQLAPSTIVTMFGENLAFNTRGVSPEDIRSGQLPTALPGTGLRVLVQNIPAGIYYVSPKQVNFLIPADLIPGKATVQVVRDGHAGPEVQVKLSAAAPALYQLDMETAIALRAGGSLLTPGSPGASGDMIVLYATGLGQVVPSLRSCEIPRTAAPLRRLPEFRVFLDGAMVEPARVAYAGTTPGYAGLYQINLALPEDTSENPEVRIAVGDELSPAGIRIPVRRK